MSGKRRFLLWLAAPWVLLVLLTLLDQIISWEPHVDLVLGIPLCLVINCLWSGWALAWVIVGRLKASASFKWFLRGLFLVAWTAGTAAGFIWVMSRVLVGM